MIDFIKNFDFEKLKLKVKPLAIAAVCFVAVFIAGFGAGRASGGGNTSAVAAKRSLNNYTTNGGAATKNSPPNNVSEVNKNTNFPKLPTGNGGVVDPNNCYIKGSKSKTYHLPDGAFYSRTNPAACFNSEEEAQGAGYTKSTR